MKIEHVALQVEDPVAMATWYVEHLGMRVVRSGGRPAMARFVADASGQTILEIYNNPKIGVPDYKSLDPLYLHLAFVTEDVAATRERLIAAGAAPVGGIDKLENGDELAMMRDPWGLAIQLARRAVPLL